jgi:NAD-dependent deacetylase
MADYHGNGRRVNSVDMKHVVVLTGAGISAESGLQTFRDHDGLWNGYKIEEVATPEAFQKNPQLVLDFYNMRRKNVAQAMPNEAHFNLAKLEDKYRVTVITQNVDDLHERAGSGLVLHLHGEIFKMRSVKNDFVNFEIKEDIHVGDLAEDGGQLRPDIVWFNEPVPMIEIAAEICKTADIFILVGTSLQVYPAAGLLDYVPEDIPKYVIDKKIPSIYGVSQLSCFEELASTGTRKVLSELGL